MAMKRTCVAKIFFESKNFVGEPNGEPPKQRQDSGCKTEGCSPYPFALSTVDESLDVFSAAESGNRVHGVRVNALQLRIVPACVRYARYTSWETQMTAFPIHTAIPS
jgi:hypothetical protein